MRFINNTPLPATMIPTSEEGDRISALFLCAIKYRIEDDRLAVTRDQWPLLLGHTQPFPNDAVLLKKGVSVCAMGSVYPQSGEARVAAATMRVGTETRTIAVFGPRVWEKSIVTGVLSPSQPLPFKSVAMAWQNAFGGVVRQPASVVTLDGEEAFLPAHESGYAYNLDGVGFYTDARHALGQPLPQLEDPAQLIETWNTYPEPVCFAPCPLWSGLRARFVMRDGQFDVSRINRVASRAAPRTTFDQIEPGAIIALGGMRRGGERLSFATPPSPVDVVVTVGGASERVPLALDAVDLDAEAAEVRLLFRATVTYELVQFDVREATLEPTSDFPDA
jgi:hypothetical protein